MRRNILFVTALGIEGVLAASPVPTVTFPSVVTSQAQFSTIFDKVINGLEKDARLLPLEVSVASAFLGQLKPTSTPTSVPQELQQVRAITSNQISIFDVAAGLLLNGLSPGTANQYIKGYTVYDNQNNVNPIEPSTPVYPSLSGDAPYSQNEATLRRAIYIPSTFTYGKNGRQPLLMVPGTATPGGINWIGNYYPLLKNSPLVDPVWLNIPLETQIDIQVSAEYVAYAAHYLRGISQNSNVTVLTWSQGGTDTQWALKHWPSTRAFVPDVVAMSPDYDGTTFGDMQCLDFPKLPCPPGARQQRPDSNFLAHLKANDGDSAYVPTTTVYSKS